MYLDYYFIADGLPMTELNKRLEDANKSFNLLGELLSKTGTTQFYGEASPLGLFDIRGVFYPPEYNDIPSFMMPLTNAPKNVWKPDSTTDKGNYLSILIKRMQLNYPSALWAVCETRTQVDQKTKRTYIPTFAILANKNTHQQHQHNSSVNRHTDIDEVFYLLRSPRQGDQELKEIDGLEFLKSEVITEGFFLDQPVAH